MKSFDLFDAFNGIDEQLVLDAAPSDKASTKNKAVVQNRFLKRFTIIAACLVLVAACVFTVLSLREPNYSSGSTTGDGNMVDTNGTEGLKPPNYGGSDGSGVGNVGVYRITDVEDFKNKLADYYDDENYGYFYMQGETSYFFPTLKLSNYFLAVIELYVDSYTYVFLPNDFNGDYHHCEDAIYVGISKTKDSNTGDYSKVLFNKYENEIYDINEVISFEIVSLTN